MSLKLPRLSSLLPIESKGASKQFARFWDQFATAIEAAVNMLDSIVLEVDGLTVAVARLNANNAFTGQNTFLVEPDSVSGYKVSGTQVVGPRQTGWTAGTGTENKGAFNADATRVISVAYTQAEVQGIQDDLLSARQRVLALEDAMRTHGLIN